jgi:hypothetical protein
MLIPVSQRNPISDQPLEPALDQLAPSPHRPLLELEPLDLQRLLRSEPPAFEQQPQGLLDLLQSAIGKTRQSPSARAAQLRPAASKSATKPGSGNGGDGIGAASDRDSPGTSIDDVVDIKLNGGPQAAKGLEIRPVRPHYSTVTRLTAAPRNAVVRVVFGKDGTVIKAEFVDGHTTGYADVDQPLLNAIYEWTATGEALDKLSNTNPRAGVSITFNIIMSR